MTYNFKIGDKVRYIGNPHDDISRPHKDSEWTIVDIYRDYVSTTDKKFVNMFYRSELELITESSEENTKYKHYEYSFKGIKLDPYRILSVYGITCPAQQHAIKKLLRAGNSVKDLKQDIQEVIDTLKRKLEMIDEESIWLIDKLQYNSLLFEGYYL